MYFVGVDLAWGEISQSGVAVVDADGRLVHLGTAHDDASIENTLSAYVRDDCLVALDAPLVVNNPAGHRPCDRALNRDFGRFEAGARPAYTGRPEFSSVPRGARLAGALALDIDPHSQAKRRAIEVYPHPATVVLFGLDRTLKYKRGPLGTRQRELLQLMTLIERLDEATPRLRVNRNVAWVELRNRVTAATRPAQLDGAEDPVDAVMCAYIALYWYHRPEDVTIYGDVATGYIVTPALPSAVGTPSAKPHEPDDVARRLARLAALLEDAQQVRSSSAAAFASTRRALIRRFPLPCGPSNGDRGMLERCENVDDFE